jgi:regulatory protein
VFLRVLGAFVVQKKLNEQELYDYAVKRLAARAYSIAEMRRRLDERARSRPEARAVLARLKDHGYLNDERFAQTYASARLENQQLGRVRVVSDLRLRLVAPEVAERAARKAYEGVAEAELLRAHLARRLRRRPPPAERRKLASLYRALRRAGFSHGGVLAELHRLRADPEVLEKLETEEDATGRITEES